MSERFIERSAEALEEFEARSLEDLDEVKPEGIFEVLPEPFNRVQLWAIWGKELQLNIFRNRELLRLVKLPVV